MTSNFKTPNDPHQPSPVNGQESSSCSPNLMQRDRFELLSAYLDGEATAAERKLVESWLASDLTVQRLHSRLLKLRHGLRSMPVPASPQATEQTVNEVFARLERKPKLSLVWGGAAIAALFIGALASNLLTGTQTPPQLAKGSQQPAIEAPQTKGNEVLLVALDKPLVDIPKAPVAIPNGTFKNTTTPAGAKVTAH